MTKSQIYTLLGVIVFIAACFVVGLITQPDVKPAGDSYKTDSHISTDIWQRD